MPELRYPNEDEQPETDPPSPDAEEATGPGDEEIAPDGGVAAASVDATFEIPTASGTARMTVPEAATAAEAAAVAAAVAAHVDEEDDETAPAEADHWTLFHRLGCRNRRELPRACASGDEWKAAARTGW